MQTRYLRFKNMSYESENYLHDINCVQLRKALIQFQCGNSHFEIVLNVWKDVPYVERFCQGCDLEKIENEKHLLFLYPIHKKLVNTFIRPYPSLTRAFLLISCRLLTRSP